MPILRSNLCDYSDAYIVVKGAITVTSTADAKNRNKILAFKSNGPFKTFISKINNIFIDSAEDPDIVMLMYKLLEYSDDYSITSVELLQKWSDRYYLRCC